MNHSFNAQIAADLGSVNAAILFEGIAFWCLHNEANGTNQHDGRCWTYNSIHAWHDLYPYMSEKCIRKALKVLIDNGLIVTGNYNLDKRDRTMWYALTDSGKCSFLCGKLQMPERENANVHKGEPLPVNYSQLFTTVIQQHHECAREEIQPEETEVKPDSEPVQNDTARVVREYRQQIGEIPNGRAYKMLCSYIDDLGADAVIVAIRETNLAQAERPWAWLKKILDGFAERGVHSAEAAEAAVNDHRRRAQSAKAAQNPQKFNYAQREISAADYSEENYNAIGDDGS